MKQGEEDTKFIKEPEEPTRDYIFQKNKKTVITAAVIAVLLLALVFGIIASGVSFES